MTSTAAHLRRQRTVHIVEPEGAIRGCGEWARISKMAWRLLNGGRTLVVARDLGIKTDRIRIAHPTVACRSRGSSRIFTICSRDGICADTADGIWGGELQHGERSFACWKEEHVY